MGRTQDATPGRTKLRAGKDVYTVQFEYGARGWSTAQGTISDAPYDAVINLKGDEYIVRVDYRSGERVDAISFKTNKGKVYGPYGGGGGTAGAFPVTPGEKLGCMAGRAGSSIDALVLSSTGLR
jgi:hypothetical protein